MRCLFRFASGFCTGPPFVWETPIIPEDKAYWRGMATAKTQAKLERGGQNFSEYLQAQGAAGLPRASAHSAKRRALAKTMEDMDKDLAWRAGAQLSSFGSVFKPELVCAKTPDSTIKSKLHRMFGFDPKVLDNPRKGLKPFNPCKVLHGGLCERDAFRSACGIGAKNIYSVFASKGISKELPVLVKLFIPGAEAICPVQPMTYHMPPSGQHWCWPLRS